MKVVQIQFSPWDKTYNFDPDNIELEIGDKVIVKTEMGTEIGDVVGFIDIADSGITPENELKKVLRNATKADLEKTVRFEEKDNALSFCKKMANKYDLPMKLVDVHFSYDGSKITFAFIADGRVDFRDLVKELTKYYNRTIRLHQIGIRDEAKISGDCGHCGLPLCCSRFLNELSSVTSEMAELQQVAHRGSERISGVCGRLMCCLGYEHDNYDDISKNLPPVDSQVKVDGRKDRVVNWHILKNSVDVEIREGDDTTIIEVDADKIKK